MKIYEFRSKLMMNSWLRQHRPCFKRKCRTCSKISDAVAWPDTKYVVTQHEAEFIFKAFSSIVTDTTWTFTITKEALERHGMESSMSAHLKDTQTTDGMIKTMCGREINIFHAAFLRHPKTDDPIVWSKFAVHGDIKHDGKTPKKLCLGCIDQQNKRK